MATYGKLRIYLGAAPGVGKTYSMLEEGLRRRDRGTDVVIGLVETHGRAKTAALIGDLPIVPRHTFIYRGRELDEMDIDAVLARHPAVALVDELAHTNAPGSRNAKRWQDIDELLDAGIDVISTLNIEHLESLNDVVAKVTGITQRETVPDAVIRAAEQVELVDMTPEALRRRMIHGNVYPAAGIDAPLNNHFRIGNLAALRELALLWVADRVEEGLDDYRSRHGITQPWETRERVLVALTGEPDDEALVRRGARLVARLRGELLAVHVRVPDGTVQSRPPALPCARWSITSTARIPRSPAATSPAPCWRSPPPRTPPSSSLPTVGTAVCISGCADHWSPRFSVAPGRSTSMSSPRRGLNRDRCQRPRAADALSRCRRTVAGSRGRSPPPALCCWPPHCRRCAHRWDCRAGCCACYWLS